MGVGLVGQIADKFVVMQDLLVYIIGVVTLLVVAWRIIKRVRSGGENMCSGCGADCSACQMSQSHNHIRKTE